MSKRWFVDGHDIRCEPDEHDSGTFIATMDSSRSPEETRANAARIVALHNAFLDVDDHAAFVAAARAWTAVILGSAPDGPSWFREVWQRKVDER